MQGSAEKIWGAAREHLRSMLSADIYNLWFAPLRACSQENNSITLEVANDFCEVWLKDNYMGLLQDVIALASGRQLQVKFKVGANGGLAAPTAQPVQGKKKAADPAPERTAVNHDLSINPRNTFDTFVVGNNNNFAYAAALAVAQVARQVVQPAVPLRRRRSGQDPSAARHRTACCGAQERSAGGLPFVREVHQRIH